MEIPIESKTSSWAADNGANLAKEKTYHFNEDVIEDIDFSKPKSKLRKKKSEKRSKLSKKKGEKEVGDDKEASKEKQEVDLQANICELPSADVRTTEKSQHFQTCYEASEEKAPLPETQKEGFSELEIDLAAMYSRKTGALLEAINTDPRSAKTQRDFIPASIHRIPEFKNKLAFSQRKRVE